MKYRDAKNLKTGDIIIVKSTRLAAHVMDVEIYGSIKKVRINCGTSSEDRVSYFQDEVE